MFMKYHYGGLSCYISTLFSGAQFVGEYTAITVLLGFPANSTTSILGCTSFTFNNRFLTFVPNNNPTPPCEACALFLQSDVVIK